MKEIPRLVLASGSPRRRALLESLGLAFSVRPADLDESLLPEEDSDRHVLRLAREKAEATAEPDEVVLGADTVVLLDGDILGKPGNAEEAGQMLTRLAGRRHTVLTGVALMDGDQRRSANGIARTEVQITAMTATEIAWYVGTREPLDKAGAYAIQGLGALFVEAIEGNYSNVVGLPIPLTRSLFDELGLDLRQFRRSTGA